MRKNLRSAFNTRQYMLSRDFEIYYYSDLNFKAVDPHRHTYYEFYILLEGNVYIEIEGRKIPCISLEGQKVFHSGYEPREKDLHDIQILDLIAL